MSFGLPVHLVRNLCCCCCPPVPSVEVPTGVLGIGDTIDLINAAEVFATETGRACADFFRTLREGPTADRFLAGRETLLGKVKELSEVEALFAGQTICANVEQRRAVVGIRLPRLERPPDTEIKERVTARWRNLDPFGTPRGVAFHGTTDDYIAWRLGALKADRGGLEYTVTREDGTLFDEFCAGPLCP